MRLCCVCLVLAAAAMAVGAAPVDSPFGINGAGWSHLGANTASFDFEAGNKRLRTLAAMGAAWDRCDFWWGRIEPTPGRFEWRDYDRAVDASRAAGVHVMPILCYDAAWSPDQSPNTPEYREQYGRYVYEVVKHFKGRISAYEIWNEPNISIFWHGTPPSAEDYTALLKVAYREAKRADPAVTVVGGAVAGMDFDFIEGILKAGAGTAMDAISVHPYQGNLGSLGPEAGGLARDLRRLKALLKLHNAGKIPIWITEMGNRSIPDPAVVPGAPQPSGRVTEQQQANYLVRSFGIALSEGVQRIFWFNLEDWPNETWGTTTANGRRKPSWYAYRAMSSVLTSKRFAAGGGSVDDRHLLAFRNTAEPVDPSRGALLAWTEGPGVAMDPAGGTATEITPWVAAAAPVRSRKVPGGSGVLINEEPVYFTPALPLLPARVKVTPAPATVASGDFVRLAFTSASAKSPVPDRARAFLKRGTPVMYPRDSHTPIPNGLRTATQGRLRLGTLPPGDYLAGYRLPDGSVAVAPLRVVPAVSVAVRPDPGKGSDLLVTMVNHTSRPIAGTATLDMVGNRTDTLTNIELGPRETMTEQVANAQAPGARLNDPLPVTFTLSTPAANGSWSGKVYFWSAGARTPGPPLTLGSAQDWQSQDGSWTGPEDLSATITAHYDARCLYLHAEVVDDTFSQPYSLGQAWRGDGFQIAVDPQWQRQPDTSASTEFGLALTPDGPQVYRWTGVPGLMPGAALKVERQGKRTIYDASIPWKELGITAPKPPRTIGFALILNDNDGSGREGWMAYGDGIATEKRADRYATLTLE